MSTGFIRGLADSLRIQKNDRRGVKGLNYIVVPSTDHFKKYSRSWHIHWRLITNLIQCVPSRM